MHRLLLLFFFLPLTAFGQEKYWITFKDKYISGYNYEQHLSKETIKNRILYQLPLYQETDIPVNQQYVDKITDLGVKVLCKSKWLNSISAFLTPEEVSAVASLSFVQEVAPIDRRIQVMGNMLDVDPNYYVVALKQMQAEKFSEIGLTGKGVKVGVIDAGFFRAFEDKNLAHLFREKKIVLQRDFLTPPHNDLVRDTTKESDHHGRLVLSMICGYDSSSSIQMGMALNSQFYLARSENEAREYRGEEDNWIAAMEWMDSIGVRLINTSLGYSINMDDPKDNYKKEEMNGKTARISKAAQIAFDEKGIFLVVSAGNEGGKSSNWKIISAPADAEGVLSVGATTDPSWERIDYSSIGPDFLPYLKPNVSCFSLYGTSFSAPAVTGFVACLMERDSSISNKDLKKIIEMSGHLYPYGNNYLGYGVPQAGKALKLMKEKGHEFGNYSEKSAGGKKIRLRFDEHLSKDAVLFHKKNNIIVIQQQSLPIKDGKIRVKRLVGVTRTTVSVGPEVVEIVWE